MSYHDNHPTHSRRGRYRKRDMESDQEILNSLQDVTVYLGLTEERNQKLGRSQNYMRAKDALDIAKQVLVRRISAQRKRSDLMDSAREDVSKSMRRLVQESIKQTFEDG